ncbi:MAG TPA: phosphoribosylformylglycinamidine cyclo-ligase [Thermomicrobiales bacterium]|nr:phosphoribosylformylglycinamidine cyclo-ligase [Thermomicrobiales bacterium]
MEDDRPNASPISYRDAGVDIDAKMQVIERVKQRAQTTLGSHAGPIGHFGGTYRIPSGPDQILVASADGVGTKLRLAFVLGGEAHTAVGRDIVHHCVNDIVALGAKPLFFLDYFATGVLDPDTVTLVIGGVADACQCNGMALLGGETAEMPDMYAPGEYDLAGFIVGTVSPEAMVDGSTIAPGDVVIGMPSTGLHTNGYSLARKILGLTGDPAHDSAVLSQPLPGDDSHGTVGEALIAEHRSYLDDMVPFLDADQIRGMAHITGGGLRDNLPRTLPKECVARLDSTTWRVPPIFRYLLERGGVAAEEQHRVFNMGIGFTLIVRPQDRDGVLEQLAGAIQIGEIVPRMTNDEAAVQGLSC